jgi:AAA15 family ATPase/GTPase
MLRKVVIKNFKSIDEAHLTLPRFGAIIGKNGSGKTNFISAIVLLKRLVDGITIEKARRQGLSFFTKEFFFMGGASNEAIFEFHFEAIDGSLFKYSFTIECTEEDNDFIISQESLYKNENIIFKRKSGNEGNVFDGKQIVPFSVDDGSLVLENYTNDSVAELRNLISNYTIVDAPVAGKNELQIVSIANLNLDTIDGVAVSLYVKNKELFDQAIESVKKIIPDFSWSRTYLFES